MKFLFKHLGGGGGGVCVCVCPFYSLGAGSGEAPSNLAATVVTDSPGSRGRRTEAERKES